MALRLLRIAVLDFRFNPFFLAFVTYWPFLPPNGHDCFLPRPPAAHFLDSFKMFSCSTAPVLPCLFFWIRLCEMCPVYNSTLPSRCSCPPRFCPAPTFRKIPEFGHWEFKHHPCCNLQSLYFQVMETERCLGNII